MELKPSRAGHEVPSGGLLIVPYGIETAKFITYLIFCILLIVPYGIETPFIQNARSGYSSFNRTLWN